MLDLVFTDVSRFFLVLLGVFCGFGVSCTHETVSLVVSTTVSVPSRVAGGWSSFFPPFPRGSLIPKNLSFSHLRNHIIMKGEKIKEFSGNPEAKRGSIVR